MPMTGSMNDMSMHYIEVLVKESVRVEPCSMEGFIEPR